MPESLMLVFRALIFQANRFPGKSFTAQLKRGLFLEVTRSTENDNYKLQCGRMHKHTDSIELTTVTANWPDPIVIPVEWKQLTCENKNEIHWMVALIKPLPKATT